MKMHSESYGSPYMSQDQPNSALPASFRALPLLASDLPFTQIQVSNSSVRPNEKGKDVLSFIVSVDPGHGKDGWRVEKLYSDVLGLDQRVRASVGKGVGKKIATLPEGKLWRDHAPAKVDQRKVS
jgi:RalA-binding protein 1